MKSKKELEEDAMVVYNLSSYPIKPDEPIKKFKGVFQEAAEHKCKGRLYSRDVLDDNIKKLESDVESIFETHVAGFAPEPSTEFLKDQSQDIGCDPSNAKAKPTKDEPPDFLPYHLQRKFSVNGSAGRFLTPNPSLKGYSETHQYVKPLAGRNEKCPCGSGKKYKKCCLGK